MRRRPANKIQTFKKDATIKAEGYIKNITPQRSNNVTIMGVTVVGSIIEKDVDAGRNQLRSTRTSYPGGDSNQLCILQLDKVCRSKQ